jgi:hypothetical protein
MADIIDHSTGLVLEEQPDAPRDENEIDIIDLMASHNNGAFIFASNEELQSVVRRAHKFAMTENRDVKGEVTIKISIVASANTLKFILDCKSKSPGPRPVGALAFGDDDGKIYRQDPTQTRMSFDRKNAFTRPKK